MEVTRKSVGIVLPVYNEEQGISYFHKELSAVLNQLGNYDFSIIYVVDRCRDNSLKILETISEQDDRVTVLGLSRRFGHQMSLVAGLDACTNDACIMMDCDLEHPPSLIPTLLRKWEDGFEIVHTKRNYPKSIGFFKRYFSKLFYRCLNKLTSEDFGESTADFRLISKSVVQVFQNEIREHNQFLRGLFRWVGFRQTEVSFDASIRKYGKSNYNMRSLIRFASSGIVSFSKAPLKMSVILGISMAILGILYALFNIVMYFSGQILPAGWTTMVTLMLIIGGMILFMLGIVGEYISAIFDEVKNRPLYIIQSRYGKMNKGE